VLRCYAPRVSEEYAPQLLYDHTGSSGHSFDVPSIDRFMSLTNNKRFHSLVVSKGYNVIVLTKGDFY
jgi:hypothetical protein